MFAHLCFCEDADMLKAEKQMKVQNMEKYIVDEQTGLEYEYAKNH